MCNVHSFHPRDILNLSMETSGRPSREGIGNECVSRSHPDRA